MPKYGTLPQEISFDEFIFATPIINERHHGYRITERHGDTPRIIEGRNLTTLGDAIRDAFKKARIAVVQLADADDRRVFVPVREIRVIYEGINYAGTALPIGIHSLVETKTQYLLYTPSSRRGITAQINSRTKKQIPIIKNKAQLAAFQK